MSHLAPDKRKAIVAYCTLGTFAAASEETGIPERTISYWVNTSDRDLFREILDELGPEIRRAQIAAYQGIVNRTADVAGQSLEQVQHAMQNGDAKDVNALASAYRSLMTGAGIATQNSELLQGKPTSIVGTDRDTDEILRNLNSLVPGLVVDSTAEEIKPTPALALTAESCGTNARDAQPVGP